MTTPEKSQLQQELQTPAGQGEFRLEASRGLGLNVVGNYFEMQAGNVELDQVVAEREVLVGRIPGEADRQAFVDDVSILPERYQAKYYGMLEANLKESEQNEVGGATGLRGTLFELRRISEVAEHGQEMGVALDFDTPNTIGRVKYQGYSKRANLAGAPDIELESDVDCDVPVSRLGEDGSVEPVIFEVKDYPRMRYGSSKNFNQLLKYQEAVRDGLAAGAVVNVKGKVGIGIFRWTGLAPQQDGTRSEDPIPNVEILYTLDLPSGAEYTTVLKPGKEHLLAPLNPELTDERDRKVVAGLETAKADGTLGDILSFANHPEPPADLKDVVDRPMSIRSLEMFHKYEGFHNAVLYDQLSAKSQDSLALVA